MTRRHRLEPGRAGGRDHLDARPDPAERSSASTEGEEYEPEEHFDDFAVGRSALRAAGPNNPRNLPCPTCGAPERQKELAFVSELVVGDRVCVLGSSSVAGRTGRVVRIKPGDASALRVSVRLDNRRDGDSDDPVWVMRPSELETPRFTHDCDGCRWLGRFEQVDLWWCPSPSSKNLDSVIGRYGDASHEYAASHPPAAFADPAGYLRVAERWYHEALKRAEAMGLYTPPPTKITVGGKGIIVGDDRGGDR